MKKNIFKNYYKSTPAKWRKVGDALLGVCLFATSYEVIRNNEHLSLAVVIVGIIGKFITNCFTEKGEDKEK